MSKNPDHKKLKKLGERLDKARREEQKKAPGSKTATSNALGKAYRMAIELVVSVAVGGAIGWYLDKWLETGPWLFIIFFFLGVAAGFRNVYKAAKMMSDQPSSGQDLEE